VDTARVVSDGGNVPEQLADLREIMIADLAEYGIDPDVLEEGTTEEVASLWQFTADVYERVFNDGRENALGVTETIKDLVAGDPELTCCDQRVCGCNAGGVTPPFGPDTVSGLYEEPDRDPTLFDEEQPEEINLGELFDRLATLIPFLEEEYGIKYVG